jgi:hypothetical protein
MSESKTMETKKVKKTSAWIEHVKKYREQHPGISYKDALKEASATYKKGGKMEVKKEDKPKKEKKEKKVKKEKKSKTEKKTKK